MSILLSEKSESALNDNGFTALNLHPVLLSAIHNLGYTAPTPVQQQVIPAALTGQDLMVSSQTGSGKTAAFLLPILHQLTSRADNGLNVTSMDETGGRHRRPRRQKPSPKALILCPTRELAQQVAKDAIALKGKQRLTISLVTGGMPYPKQIKALDNVDVLIATPGRLLDLFDQHALTLAEVNFFVCDEADRMLDLGFSEDLEAIFTACPNIEQSLMFSATFPPKVMALAATMMQSPEQILLAPKDHGHNNIQQFINWSDNNKHQESLLLHWLDHPELDQCIVFAPTQIQTEQLAERLTELDYPVVALHGGMTQKMRNHRLDSFRKKRASILVATDVVARGIDIATITHVINYGLPTKAEDYVHRIGRTGRAGRQGTAIALIGSDDRRRLQAIEQHLRIKMQPSEIEGLEPKTPFNSYSKSKNEGRRNGGGSRNGNAARRSSGSGRGGYAANSQERGSSRERSEYSSSRAKPAGNRNGSNSSSERRSSFSDSAKRSSRHTDGGQNRQRRA